MNSTLIVYLLLSLGIILQGEIALLGVGHLIHSGSVNFFSIIFIATLLSFINNEIIFALSKAGFKLLPIQHEKILKTGMLIEKYKTLLLLFSRFIYGTRNIIPALFGLTDIKHLEFSILNFIGALIWALTFTTIGLISGKTLSLFLDVRKYQMLIFGFFLGIAFTITMLKILKLKRG
ncbi:MAG: VTT domain-containing protein [Candidatus Kryptonium sp.]|nr:VTT domain-containing protein [Candidatus Kryptonium sp.]MCX7763140.1 VTT domain-containing protein [Candidatus Kryptonium sp.]MDW8109109.1 VTT domain-containing protein [Candidatus Kryptonium sp.]